MPRPCLEDHPLSPEQCRVCRWCTDDSEIGAFHRRSWGEPEPHNGRAFVYAPLEIVPGLIDPIAEPAFQPVPARWPHDPRVIDRHRQGLRRLVDANMPAPAKREGAGVLFIGGGKYWPGIVVSIRMLRDTGSTLPVQIWHRGAEEPVRLDDLADVHGISVHDLTKIRPRPRTLGGWEAKTLAMLACGWERVFFLDADAYTLVDPGPCLERLSPAEPFLFWEDHAGAQGAVQWPVWGLHSSSVPPVQGGQLFIHVSACWRDLVLAHWLNQHSDFTYAHQFGDQDSWRVALTMSGGAYVRLGPSPWEEIAHVCYVNGQPAIVHRCQAKMFFPEDMKPGDVQSGRRCDRLPAETRAWAHWEGLLAARSAPDVFGGVYQNALWGAPGYSGDGSSPLQAQPYLDLVNGLIKLSGWQRVIDLGAGDGYVASRLDAPEVIAVECHAPHVQRLRSQAPAKHWLHLDLDRDRDRLPCGDVALLKDVLHHWPNRLVRDWLAWAQTCGKWRWLICTQDRQQSAENDDCLLGGYRALSPAMEPLRSFAFVPLCEYLYKSVLLLPIAGPPASKPA